MKGRCAVALGWLGKEIVVVVVVGCVVGFGIWVVRVGVGGCGRVDKL